MRPLIVAVSALVMNFSSAPSLGQAVTYEQALDKVGAAIAERLKSSPQKSATVLDFTNLDSLPTQLGKLVAQDLTDNLVRRVTNLNWIDRSQRDFVLKENRLAADKLMEPATRKQLGRLIGVDTIVVGTVTTLSRQVRLQARAIDIETARVLAVDSVTFQLSESMAGLADRAVSGSADANSSPSKSESAGSTFRNRVLAVSARSLSITGNWQGLVPTATVEIENISGQDFWLGVLGVSIGPCAFGGTRTWQQAQVNGANTIDQIFELQSISTASSQARQQRLTALPAGGRLVIVTTYVGCETSNNGAFLGKAAPVSLNLVLDFSGKFQRFSAGISDFPITSNTFTLKQN